MRVGGIQVDRPLRVSLYRGKGTGAGGWAMMLFPVKKDKLVLRAIAMTLAGPAANLASGYAVFLLPFTKGLFAGCFVFSSIVGRDRQCVSISVSIYAVRW
jgi:hypothetical protein